VPKANRQLTTAKASDETLSADMAALCRHIRSETSVAIALHQNPDHDAAGAAVGLRDLFVQRGVPAAIHLSVDEHLPSHTFFLDEAELARRMPADDTTLYVLDTGSFRAHGAGGRVVEGHHRQYRPPSRQHAFWRPGLRAWPGQQHGGDHLRRLRRTRRSALAGGRYRPVCRASRSTRATSATASTSAHTLRQAAWLVALGADPAAVYRELYEQRSLAALRLWARAVANTTSVSDGRALVSLLTLADYQAAGAGEDETEAIVDMLRSVGG